MKKKYIILLFVSISVCISCRNKSKNEQSIIIDSSNPNKQLIIKEVDSLIRSLPNTWTSKGKFIKQEQIGDSFYLSLMIPNDSLIVLNSPVEMKELNVGDSILVTYSVVTKTIHSIVDEYKHR